VPSRRPSVTDDNVRDQDMQTGTGWVWVCAFFSLVSLIVDPVRERGIGYVSATDGPCEGKGLEG
jgi:hypothetical protein